MTMGMAGAGLTAAAAGAEDTLVNPRVRSSNPSIAMVIERATERSKIFRRLVGDDQRQRRHGLCRGG